MLSFPATRIPLPGRGEKSAKALLFFQFFKPPVQDRWDKQAGCLMETTFYVE